MPLGWISDTRLDLRQWFETHMGERLARAMMEAMPPVDYANLATKEDLAVLRTELRAELHLEMAKQTRLLVTMQITSLAATIGLASLLGS